MLFINKSIKIYIIFLLFVLFTCCSQRNNNNNLVSPSEDWFKYCNKHGRYSVSFPNEPTNYDTVITNHFKKYNVKSYFVFYNSDSNEYNDFYMVEFKVYSDSVLNMIGYNDLELIDSYIDTLKNGIKAEVVKSEYIKNNNCTINFSKLNSISDNHILNIKIFMCYHKLYTLIVSSNTEEQRNIYINKFFDSFAIENCK